MVHNYQERQVHRALAQLVVCTWVDRSTEHRHPVLPDACIDIVWDGTELRVVGPDTGPTPILSQATFVGIRFRPGAAPSVLGVAASELLDRTVLLSDVWGHPADELAEQLVDDPAGAAGLLQVAILSRYDAAVPPDPLVAQMVHCLQRRGNGAPVVEKVARQLDISERSLHRRCVSAVGYGPKTLDRVLRFRRALRLIRSRVTLVDAAQLAGYADQAHLAYEFNRLAGATPGQFLRQPHVPISSNGYL